MNLRLKILAGVLPAAAALLLLSFLFLRRRRQQHLTISSNSQKSKFQSLQSGLNKLYKSGNSLRFHHLHHHSPATTSPEFMQTVRLKKTSGEQNFSFVRASFPLPSPGSAQEAYFEISLIYLQTWRKKQESDRISSTAPIMISPCSSTEEKRCGDVVVVVGLISRVDVGNEFLPGAFDGSIGFHSDGSIYLDGKKLVFESEKAEWGDVNRVIGCGFAPRKKKVFFTVDSQLVLVIKCSSEVYSNPLFPIIACNSDAMILVNLGQTPFKYAPANATRTKNPSFVRISSESCELFSEFGRSKNEKNYYSSSSKKSNGCLDEGLEAESDLFEISLQR